MTNKCAKPTKYKYVNILVDIAFGEGEISVDEEATMVDRFGEPVSSAGKMTKVMKAMSLPQYKNENVKKKLEGLTSNELVIYSKNSGGLTISQDVIRDPRILR